MPRCLLALWLGREEFLGLELQPFEHVQLI